MHYLPVSSLGVHRDLTKFMNGNISALLVMATTFRDHAATVHALAGGITINKDFPIPGLSSS